VSIIPLVIICANYGKKPKEKSPEKGLKLSRKEKSKEISTKKTHEKPPKKTKTATKNEEKHACVNP